MRGRRVLHLGHKDADCDALGSAYSLSCILPGDVGFPGGLKTSARDLAQWLELEPVIDPDPATYDYVIIFDTPSWALLNHPPLQRYALFDHHVQGGHRFSAFDSELAAGAEWCWIRPYESTCAVLAELFLANGMPLSRRMAVALAAGTMTDTDWLRLANGAALRRLAAVLEVADLYLEDVLAAIDSPNRALARRAAVLAALKGIQETLVGFWSVLATRADSHDHGFAVSSALGRLGGDVRVVVFPKDDMAMAMIECDGSLVERTGIDLSRIAAGVSHGFQAGSSWGTQMWGRVVVPACLETLSELSVAAVVQALGSPGGY
jgi:nanoRNase/pAp phosphatase (c-di-AMP/oligoRNAs hydrolase)